MTSDRAEETQGRLRRLHLDLVSGAISAVGALLVAVDAQTWPDAILLGAGLFAALVVVSRWTRGRFLRVALPCLAVTAAVWLFGVLVMDSGTASYGFAIVATIIILELPRHRWAAVAGTAAFAVAVVVAKLVVSHEDVLSVLIRYALVSTAVAVGGIALPILAPAIQDLIGELERAREREAELAVAQERMRFASDLHDIQGHTLDPDPDPARGGPVRTRARLALSRRVPRSPAH